ncbi:MAG: GatB/YqeY domain-containing protein [Methylococcaceae bacterium]
MSTLKERLQADMKSAMKSGAKARLGVIRLINSAIKQREVDERINLEDADVIAILDKMVKQRRESISQFEAANRQDLADAEKAEITVLHDYLPTALTDDEIDNLIAEAMAEVGTEGPSAMGKIMALLKPKMQGRADMTAVSARVKARLSP